MEEIAERLIGLRESMDLSCEELADQLNMDASLYKLYETGQVEIPMSFLCEISVLSKIDTAVLLSGEDTHNESYFVTRKGKGIPATRSKAYKYRSLAGSFKDAKSTPFLVTVEPNNNKLVLNSHPGQEFNLVQEGKLLLQIGGKDILLEQGDSIYFDANIPHGMKTVNNQKAHFLAIIL